MIKAKARDVREQKKKECVELRLLSLVATKEAEAPGVKIDPFGSKCRCPVLFLILPYTFFVINSPQYILKFNIGHASEFIVLIATTGVLIIYPLGNW